jgi:hypothetical protein
MYSCEECGNDFPIDYAFCTGCGAANPEAGNVESNSQSSAIPGSIGRLDDLDPIEISIGEYEAPPAEQNSSGNFIKSGAKKAKKESESLVTFHSDDEQLSNLESRLEVLEAERSKLESDLIERQDFLESLEKWERKNSSSFLFKVFKKMKFNLSEAADLLQRYTAIVENLVLPNPGVMHSLRKKFHKTLLLSYTIVPGIALFFIYLPSIMAKITGAPELKGFIEDYLYFSKTTIVLWALFALFLLTWNALISYYKGWSRFQATVNRTVFDLENVANGAAHVRSEEARLKALYPQVKEWLEILGRSLNRPWLVQPEWYQSTEGAMTRDLLPNSLRIAQAVEDDSPSMLAMQRYAAESFMAKGWRARVFAEQIDIIREAKGLPKERLSVEQLDQDITYSPTGPRAIVASLIGDERILETVARKQIQPLAVEIQKETSGNTRPDIREIPSAKPKKILGNTGQSDQELKPWDEFLALPIGGEGKPTVPLSLASFSDDGQRANQHSRAKSFFITPARLQNLTGVPSSQIRTYAESERMPMDIVVRLDLVGPVQNSELSILEGAEKERLAARSKVEEKIQKEFSKRQSGI